MSGSREGGCACGAVRYRLTSDPLFTHCCHCLNCQRQTGSAFVINVLIEADRVQLLAGAPQPVEAPRDDGSKQLIFRCPTCQVAVFSQYGRPEVMFVRGGTLDQPSGIAPDVHIFTRSKLPWITLPDSVPAFEVYYDSKALWPAASLERQYLQFFLVAIDEAPEEEPSCWAGNEHVSIEGVGVVARLERFAP